jgi:4-amino-4-deoxy-L-arabinose transferase-like glycosyltransferase
MTSGMAKRKKPGKVNKPSVERTTSKTWAWMTLAIIVLVFVAIRIRLLSVPLERDEGEYAYAGQLILQGIPPYRMAYNMKLPGIYYAYALTMAIFGQGISGIHLGLLVVNSGAIVLTFLIGKRLFDSTVGLVAAAAYGFLTINRFIFGVQAHATHFVVLPALGGILLALKATESRRLSHILWSGLLVGIGFTMKQQGIFFIIFVLVYVIWSSLRERPVRLASLVGRVLLFAGGSAIPLVLICIVLYADGVFARFWFWAVGYAAQYVSLVPLSRGIQLFIQNTKFLLVPNYLLWILAGIGLIFLWADGKSRARGMFVTSLFVFSFLTICPGYFFRQHYYVTWMPALALLIGVAVGAGRNLLRSVPTFRSLSYAPAGVFVIAMFITVNSQADFLFSAPVDAASRMMYRSALWTETQEIGKYIKERTSPADTIAVLGSEPQLYFYTDRKSATGYIYTYALMEPQKFAHEMQMEMIGEIEKSRPRFIVLVDNKYSWLVQPYSDRTILDWQFKYCESNYLLAGFVQSYHSGPRWFDYRTDYVWKGQTSSRQPNPKRDCIYVFERK